MLEELEGIKKQFFINSICSGLGALVNPILGLPLLIAPLIDEILHWDEPLNPIFGGDYSNWTPGGAR
jgi:hypothetical protein